MELQFNVVQNHRDTTHFLIEDEDPDKLNAIGVENGKLYNLYFDEKADEFYIINEEGTRCVDIDVLVRVKMLQQSIK